MAVICILLMAKDIESIYWPLVFLPLELSVHFTPFIPLMIWFCDVSFLEVL